MRTAHKHFRVVLHLGCDGVEQAMRTAQEIERLFLKLDPGDPYVNVLSIEERLDPPDPHICPRCGFHWDACTCPSDSPAILPEKEEEP